MLHCNPVLPPAGYKMLITHSGLGPSSQHDIYMREHWTESAICRVQSSSVALSKFSSHVPEGGERERMHHGVEWRSCNGRR